MYLIILVFLYKLVFWFVYLYCNINSIQVFNKNSTLVIQAHLNILVNIYDY